MRMEVAASEKERRAKIAQLAAKTEEHHKLITFDGNTTLPVIEVPLECVVLNHQSERIASALEDSPEWAELSSDPTSPEAQRLIASIVKEASGDEYKELLASLKDGEQNEVGHVTYKGVLVNANTRKVALMELGNPNRKLRVVVLPSEWGRNQEALLEDELQNKRESKAPYRLIPRLRAVKNQSDQGMKPEVIAKRRNLRSGAAGAKEVNLQLEMLALIEEMQQMESPPLPNAFFNAMELETMKVIQEKAATYLKNDEPEDRERYLNAAIIFIATGVGTVHKLRQLDVHFWDDYGLERLYESDLVAQGGDARPLLEPLISEDGDPDLCDVAALRALVVGSGDVDLAPEGRVRVTLPKDDLRKAVAAAADSGVTERKIDQANDNKLAKAGVQMQKASKAVSVATEAVLKMKDNPEFQEDAGSLRYKFRNLRKGLDELSKELTEAGILK